MSELPAILERWRQARAGERLALATVVKARGSVYRRPGARMLITAQGSTVGAISGGCLESDVCEHALRVLASGKPVVIHYETGSEGEILYGVGLGCGGSIDVLIEPVKAGDAHSPLAFLSTCLVRRQAGVIATIVKSGDADRFLLGARLMLSQEGSLIGDWEGGELLQPVMAAMDQVLRLRRSEVRDLAVAEGRVEICFEFVPPPVSLVIFGAGHDAQPLASFAKQLGWHVTILDHRPAYATSERFPAADTVVCADPGALPETIRLDTETIVMIMNHHYLQDREWLQTLLPQPVRYLGVLGPRARTERLLGELQAEGRLLEETWRARLYYPAGIDIGAETPEEIALSILAEMRAVIAGRSGGRLRDYSGPIHAPDVSTAPSEE